MERLEQVKEYEEQRLAELEAGGGVPDWVDELFPRSRWSRGVSASRSTRSGAPGPIIGAKAPRRLGANLGFVGPPPYRVVYGEPIPEDLIGPWRSRHCHLVSSSVLSPDPSEGSLVENVRDADFLIVATSCVNEVVVRAAQRLRLIQAQGVGYDNVDLTACLRAGVPVALTPEGTSVGVA